MSRFRFSRWLAGLSSLFAVVLIAAGGASAQTITLWDFAALLGAGGAGACSTLTDGIAVPQTGFGSIVLSSPDATLTVKGGDGTVGDTERGLGLGHGAAACNGEDEVGDGGPGTLLLNFNNVQPPGTTLTEVQLGSLQTGECYHLSISTTGPGGPFVALAEACGGLTVTVPIGLPTAGLVLKFEKASGAGVNPATDNDYVVNSVTTSSPAGCTLTQGFWKTHGGTKKNIPNAWPVDTLTIGGIVYTKAELIAIMEAPTAGNGIMSLVQQLIAAKLNVLSGADPSSISAAIAAADTLIDNAGDKIVIGPPSSPFLDPSVTSALNTALTNFNEGTTGPGHCTE
jgi:hypothetical protein